MASDWSPATGQVARSSGDNALGMVGSVTRWIDLDYDVTRQLGAPCPCGSWLWCQNLQADIPRV